MTPGQGNLNVRFFFGDPVRVAGGFYMSYDKQPFMDYINTFLDQGLADGE